MNTPRRPASSDDADLRIEPAVKRRAGKKRAVKKAIAPKRKASGTAAKAKRRAVKKKVGKKPAARKAAPAKKARKQTVKKKALVKKKIATPKKKAPTKKAPKKKVAVKKKVVKKKISKKKVTTKQAATKKSVGRKAVVKKAGATQKRAAPAKKKTVRRRKAVDAPPPEHPELPVDPEADGGASAPPDVAEAKVADAPDAVEPAGAPAIPPLPEDEDEIVPYEEEEEKPAEAAREAPAGTAPAKILEGIRKGAYHVSALGVLDDAQVARLARDQGLRVRERERRSETLYRLLQQSPARKRPETAYVEGLLELHPDGYGFLRSPERGYAQHPEDVYVAAGLIRKLGLKPGHWISGTARRSRPGEPLLALQHVEEVNHEDASDLEKVTPFENLTVVFPDTRFLLEVATEDLEMRVMDLFCPLGRGQRALIVSPPRAGKTVILQKLADAVAHNSPDVDIVVLLVDERPEEVTSMRRSVRGEVIASTFDRPATNHIRIAELVMEKVKRMVEYGRHVVLLLDSITRLGRAYNNTSGPSGRILTGGLEAKALTKPKRFFGAARNIEDGGSLTIVATALVETGSRMDDVIFEEFKGSGNMEVVLDRDMANARIWPAINLPASGTRNEDLLLHPEELRRVNLMRKAMSGQDPQSVMDGLREQMVQYRTNAELLMSVG